MSSQAVKGAAIGCAKRAENFDALCFRLNNDGRKWKHLCAIRCALFNRLALAANPDGTEIKLGIPRLQKVGTCRSNVFNLLDDLAAIGCVLSELHQDRDGNIRERLAGEEYKNTKVRRINFEPLERAPAVIDVWQG